MKAIALLSGGLFGVLWCTISVAQLQHLPFKHLSQYDGLLQQDNFHIFQDSKGYTWISSVSGLNRFNGVQVKTYTPNASNPCALYGHNVTSPFFEDEASNIWFTTYEGLNCWDRKNDCFSYHPLKDQTGKPIAADNLLFARDEAGRFWILTGYNCLYTYHPGEKKQKKAGDLITNKCFPGFEKGRLRYVLFYQQQLNQLGVFTIEKGNIAQQRFYKLESLNLSVKNLSVNAILYAGNDRVWVASDKGLVYLNLKDLTRNMLFQLPEFKNASPGATSLCRFSETQLLVGSDFGGVYIFDEIERKFTRNYRAENPNNQGLTGNDVRNVYKDVHSNIWVALFRGEINYASIEKSKFETSFTQSELPVFGDNVNICHLMEDADGTCWIGTQNDGIFAAAPNGRIRHYLLTEEKNDQEEVFRLFQDKNGTVWSIRGSGLISCFDKAAGHWVDLNRNAPPPLDMVLSGIYAHNGDLIVGRYQGGLFAAKKEHGLLTATRIDPHPDALTYTYLYETADSHLYACRNWEQIDLFSIIKGQWTLQHELEIKGFVNAIVENRTRDTLYIATSFGLVCLSKKNHQFRTITTADGLPDQNIQAILEDDAGHLWFSTKRGIVQYVPKRGTFRAYSLSDGLQGLEFMPAACRLKDGRFLFGGVHGVNSFRPEKIRPITTRPPVEITALQINDTLWRHPVCNAAGARNINEVKKIRLAYDQNTIALSFVGIDYSDAYRVAYRYFMENYDNPGDTTDAGYTGFAKYTRLPPGNYIFHIFATNADGAGTSHRSLQIEITPPFWQTWWFRTLEILAFLALLWASVRIYINMQLKKVRIQQEKQAALQRERDRIASEMHDDLGSGLSTIHLMSERIRQGIEDPLKIEQISRISRHSGDLIEKMATIIWAMNSSHDTLEGLFGYLRRYASEYMETHDLNCRFPVPPNLPDVLMTGDKRRQIFLAFKEVLHNIVKHARANGVVIDFNPEGMQVVISIADDGIGLPEEKKYGNGLANISKRMGIIGGTCAFIKNQPAGTIVQLTIPL